MSLVKDYIISTGFVKYKFLFAVETPADGVKKLFSVIDN